MQYLSGQWCLIVAALSLSFVSPLSHHHHHLNRRDAVAGPLATGSLLSSPLLFPRAASADSRVGPPFDIGDSLSAKLQQRSSAVLKKPLFNLPPAQPS